MKSNVIKPHIYMPDYQAMGDCRICGHEQKKPWHIGDSMMKLTFEDLRFANVQRNKEWDPDNKLTASFRGLEASGEIGELLEKAAVLLEMSVVAGKLNNFIKKLERERMGIPGSRVTWHELAQEWADCIITLDLIGMHFSIDAEVIRFKFNVTSEKMGLATRL